MSEKPLCEVCGEPMPNGEEMFKFHGYSGNCPKPPLKKTGINNTEDGINSNIPMGVNEWLEHGKKYGYDKYLLKNQLTFFGMLFDKNMFIETVDHDVVVLAEKWLDNRNNVEFKKIPPEIFERVVNDERAICRQIFIDKVDWSEWGITDEQAGKDFDSHRAALFINETKKEEKN